MIASRRALRASLFSEFVASDASIDSAIAATSTVIASTCAVNASINPASSTLASLTSDKLSTIVSSAAAIVVTCAWKPCNYRAVA